MIAHMERRRPARRRFETGGREVQRSGNVGPALTMEWLAEDWSVHMNVQTTRFGTIEVDDSRIITFPAGLLGFSSFKKYALLQPDDDGVFFWLQSVETPDLAFVVSDPSLWVEGYEATIRREQM